MATENILWHTISARLAHWWHPANDSREYLNNVKTIRPEPYDSCEPACSSLVADDESSNAVDNPRARIEHHRTLLLHLASNSSDIGDTEYVVRLLDSCGPLDLVQPGSDLRRPVAQSLPQNALIQPTQLPPISSVLERKYLGAPESSVTVFICFMIMVICIVIAALSCLQQFFSVFVWPAVLDLFGDNLYDDLNATWDEAESSPPDPEARVEPDPGSDEEILSSVQQESLPQTEDDDKDILEALQQSQNQIESLTSTLAERNHEIEGLKEKVEGLEAELVAATESLDIKLSEIETLDEHQTTFQSRVQEQERVIARLKEEEAEAARATDAQLLSLRHELEQRDLMSARQDLKLKADADGLVQTPGSQAVLTASSDPEGTSTAGEESTGVRGPSTGPHSNVRRDGKPRVNKGLEDCKWAPSQPSPVQQKAKEALKPSNIDDPKAHAAASESQKPTTIPISNGDEKDAELDDVASESITSACDKGQGVPGAPKGPKGWKSPVTPRHKTKTEQAYEKYNAGIDIGPPKEERLSQADAGEEVEKGMPEESFTIPLSTSEPSSPTTPTVRLPVVDLPVVSDGDNDQASDELPQPPMSPRELDENNEQPRPPPLLSTNGDADTDQGKGKKKAVGLEGTADLTASKYADPNWTPPAVPCVEQGNMYNAAQQQQQRRRRGNGNGKWNAHGGHGGGGAGK